MLSINKTEAEFQGSGDELILEMSLLSAKLIQVLTKEHGASIVVPGFIAVMATTMDTLTANGNSELSDQLKVAIYRMSKMIFPDEEKDIKET